MKGSILQSVHIISEPTRLTWIDLDALSSINWQPKAQALQRRRWQALKKKSVHIG